MSPIGSIRSSDAHISRVICAVVALGDDFPILYKDTANRDFLFPKRDFGLSMRSTEQRNFFKRHFHVVLVYGLHLPLF